MNKPRCLQVLVWLISIHWIDYWFNSATVIETLMKTAHHYFKMFKSLKKKKSSKDNKGNTYIINSQMKGKTLSRRCPQMSRFPSPWTVRGRALSWDTDVLLLHQLAHRGALLILVWRLFKEMDRTPAPASLRAFQYNHGCFGLFQLWH